MFIYRAEADVELAPWTAFLFQDALTSAGSPCSGPGHQKPTSPVPLASFDATWGGAFG